ncbi:MAG: MBOAT family protein, partial [Rhodospirillales bacterium]
MLFNSHAFILLFLPVTLGGFWVLKRLGVGVSIVWLSILSTLFYVWWNPLYLPLLLSSIAFNFFMGRLVGKTQSKLLAGLAISANIGLLLYYKYLHFFTSLIPSDLGVPVIPELVLPLAISFFTFTQIGYIVEVLRGKLLGHSFKEYYFFVAFFPHLIAGPIVQAGVLLPQLRSGCFKADSRMFAAGLTLFVMGLFKKVLIADPIAAYANPIFYAAEAGQALTIIEAWTGALAYSLQLYYDFSGYSDMAIGLGAMFGIRFPMNFNSP